VLVTTGHEPCKKDEPIEIIRRPRPPNLAPSKFQEKLSGASRMQGNLLAADFTALLHADSLAGKEAAPPQEPHPTLGLLGLRLWPFGPRPWPEIGGLAPPNMMGWIRL